MCDGALERATRLPFWRQIMINQKITTELAVFAVAPAHSWKLSSFLGKVVQKRCEITQVVGLHVYLPGT